MEKGESDGLRTNLMFSMPTVAVVDLGGFLQNPGYMSEMKAISQSGLGNPLVPPRCLQAFRISEQGLTKRFML